MFKSHIFRLVIISILISGIGIFLAVRAGNPDALIMQDGSSATAVDTSPLEVEVMKPTRNAVNNFTEITVISNKEISAEPNNRLQFRQLGVVGEKIYYIASVINLPEGEISLPLRIADAAGQKHEQELIITRKSAGNTVPGWENAEYVIDLDKYTGPINKSKRLLEDYEPADLVDLNQKYGIFTFNDASIRADAAAALKRMLDALRKETGKLVTVASGYRSYNTQVETYAYWLNKLGRKEADFISARPGHSEHQLGTTVDFVNDETNWQIDAKFAKTTAGKWIASNATKYGFKMSLNEKQDDYQVEPWHFRYIGE